VAFAEGRPSVHPGRLLWKHVLRILAAFLAYRNHILPPNPRKLLRPAGYRPYRPAAAPSPERGSAAPARRPSGVTRIAWACPKVWSPGGLSMTW